MMKLTLENFREIALGAVDVVEEHGAFRFHRFTEEQYSVYKGRDMHWYERAAMPAGIKLSFQTDSRSLHIACNVEKILPYYTFSVDVLEDGVYLDSMDNFSDVDLPDMYANTVLPLGEFSKTFSLKRGEKHVDVYLPYGVKFELLELSLDDDATIIPVRPERILLTIGDSITHGFHALRSFHRYAAQLARRFGMEEYCKCVGGEHFLPELAKMKDAFCPDCILVAYGTNDWEHFADYDSYYKACEAFFASLCENYPDSRTVVITPIWRGDWSKVTKVGAFSALSEVIRKVTERYSNIVVVDGTDLVPHEKHCFADGFLHPSEEGHAFYYRRLLQVLEKLL